MSSLAGMLQSDSVAVLDEDVEAVAQRVRRSLAVIRSGRSGVGAGIVWRSQGVIVTNYHVVAHGSLRVSAGEGEEQAAEVLAVDPELDLAVLRSAAPTARPAAIGDSQRLRVGQLVMAIGHPWGSPGVITAGIISSLGQVATSRSGEVIPILRTDVGLAPGNSGGPLVDAAGTVIGINTMIAGGDQSIAIPSHIAGAFVAAALDRQTALGVGVRPVPLPAAALAQVGRKQTRGLLVSELQPNGPAAGAGVALGDILVDLAGSMLDSPRALMQALAAHRPGQRVVLALLRGQDWHWAEVGLARLE